jgi:hypothetical protein
VEFAAELQASLQEFVSSGVVEVRENGGRVAPFSGMSWEVRGAGEKPLLHLWSEQITRYGYFPGLELQHAPPLVYLVAPALRFHPSTDDLLDCLSPEMEIVRVGVVESWRRGLRVVMRQ